MRAGRIVVIGDLDAVFGLGLLGLEGRAVATAAEARSALDAILRDPTVALVLLTEDWAARLQEAEPGALTQEALDRSAVAARGPMVVEIPAPGASEPTGDLHERVRKALGFRFED